MAIEIDWGPDLQLGHGEMDAEHCALAAEFNELARKLSTGMKAERAAAIIAELLRGTELHFQHEEELMREAGYASLEIHRSEHRQLIEKIRRFERKLKLGQERINRPVLQFLNYWLTQHIKGSDKAFALSRADADEPATESSPA